MSTLIPRIDAYSGYLPDRDGVIDTPLIWWHAYAGDINTEGGSSVSNGRYIEPTGDIEGAALPTFGDTYLNGTGSRSGRAMDNISGTWKDDFVSPWSDHYALFQPVSDGSYWEVLDHAANANGIQHTLVAIRLSNAAAAIAHTPSNTYTYLELANGATTNYRISMRFGMPISLEYTDPVLGGNWQPVQIARNLGNLENYLAQTDGWLRLHIKPDVSRGLLLVEIGDGNWLRGPVPRPNVPTSLGQVGNLPTIERFRLYGAYRSATFEAHPLGYQAPTIQKSKRYFGVEDLANVGNALVGTNLLGSQDSPQTMAPTLQADGAGNLSYSLTVTNQDTTKPQRISDVIILIPPTWRTSAPGVPLPTSILPAVQMRELQVWDDASRTGYQSGRLLVNNQYGRFTGAFGNYAIDLFAGNGLKYGKRVTGMIGADPDGLHLTRQDPFRFVDVPVKDMMAKLADVGIEQEMSLDGLCIYTAVRLLCYAAGVHDKYLLSIPNTGLPPYSNGFPFYILGGGLGNNPKYRYLPGTSVLSILQELVQDSIDPYLDAPFMMWFDVNSQFHFEAFAPQRQAITKWFSQYDTGDGYIYKIDVFNSVAQMRTAVTLQGQDALTYELMQYHLPLPGNIGAVGYRLTAFERNSRYATPAYMAKLGRIAAYQASLPTQVVRLHGVFDPTFYAGQVFGVAESVALGRVGLFVAVEIDSHYGVMDPESMGAPVHHGLNSIITGRSIESFLPF